MYAHLHQPSLNFTVPFSLLIVKMSRFEFGPDHSLPSTHLGLSATALVVAGGFLPCHPPFGLDFCNMAIADRWNQHRLRAGNGSLGRWDNDLHDLTKACRQKISGWRSIIGAVGNELLDGATDLVPEVLVTLSDRRHHPRSDRNKQSHH